MLPGAGGTSERASGGIVNDQMQFLTDRRVLLAGGAVVALACGVALAWVFLLRAPRSSAPPTAGLVVESGRDDDLKLDPKRPLRCFVGGQFVGELPLSVCAQRNGVAAGALDVGLDQSGALAATNGAAATITPLPPEASNAASSSAEATNATPAKTADDAAVCWRYGDGGWRRLPEPISLSACAQAVFGGRCAPDGEAFYGRWGDEALRLTGGAVEISSDNEDFHSLIDPWPACEAAVP